MKNLSKYCESTAKICFALEVPAILLDISEFLINGSDVCVWVFFTLYLSMN